MKKAKTPVAFALILALALSLSGCGTVMSESVTALVQGNLDELYLGQYNEDFLALTETSEAEAEQNYLDGIDVEAGYFLDYFAVEYPTDELRAELAGLYREIYSHSKYEVGEATKIDGETYGVPVTIYPIDVMQQVSDAADAAIAELNARWPDEALSSEEAYMQYDAEWAAMFVSLCRDALANPGYMDPQEIIVQVSKGSDGRWMISDDDFQRIDLAVIYYP